MALFFFFFFFFFLKRKEKEQPQRSRASDIEMKSIHWRWRRRGQGLDKVDAVGCRENDLCTTCTRKHWHFETSLVQLRPAGVLVVPWSLTSSSYHYTRQGPRSRSRRRGMAKQSGRARAPRTDLRAPLETPQHGQNVKRRRPPPPL